MAMASALGTFPWPQPSIMISITFFDIGAKVRYTPFRVSAHRHSLLGILTFNIRNAAFSTIFVVPLKNVRLKDQLTFVAFLTR